jgi:protein-disulfide isomerase
MDLPRRVILSGAATMLGSAAAVSQTAGAPSGGDPRLAERTSGRANAPVSVIEYFSLTCSHCAAFHRDTYPRVRRELVEAGRIRMVFVDFPLDQLALAAHCVARSVPAARYDEFLTAMFAAQDRWAFGRGVDHMAEIARLAAPFGLTSQQVEAAVFDEALQRHILGNRQRGERDHRVATTPTFVFSGSTVVQHPGNLAFDRFATLAANATPR